MVCLLEVGDAPVGNVRTGFETDWADRLVACLDALGGTEDSGKTFDVPDAIG
jgi:hypothetical protein